MPERGYLRRLSTLALLYFVQGAPYGFQTSCLPLILRKQGLSYSKLGALKLLFIPWVCKPLYAPVVERTKSDLWWLVMSMLCMFLTCGLSALIGDLSLGTLSFVLFILNLASATQDITVDSVAIRILKPTELGAGNTVQVVAYKLGALTVGGGLLWVGESIGHSFMWYLFAFIYLVSVCLVVTLDLIDKKPEAVAQEEPKSVVLMIQENLRQIFNVEGTLWMVVFLLTYKLCERGEAVFPLYLVDKRFSLQRLALWNGMVRSFASISGSGVGGYLLSSCGWSPRRLLLSFSCVRILPILLQTATILAWGLQPIQEQEMGGLLNQGAFYLSILSLCVGNFCAGAVTTGAFTAMMNLSQGAHESLRSTHYSLLATIEVLGKLSFATVSGVLIDQLGLLNMFSLFSLFSLLTIPLLLVMPFKDNSGTKEEKQD